MYVSDDLGGYLPPGWTFGHPASDQLEINEGKWNSNYIASYMGHDDQRGRWEGFGATYLRCPSQEEDCYRTYGRIYSGYDNSAAWGWSSHEWAGSSTGSYGRRLDDLEGNWFLVSDHHNRDWGSGDGGNRSASIYHKTGWAYSVDWDGDGINDSYAFVGSQGPYNAWGPWHFRSGNMLYKDGHVDTTTIEEYVTNRDGVQGPGGQHE
jgi:hypothetical protein